MIRATVLFIFAAAAAAAQSFGGSIGDYAPYPFATAWLNTAGGVQTWANLNAANIKGSYCGYLSTASGASKTLQNIHFFVGTANKASGTDLRAGIQSPSTTTGPGIQPDGTWLASGAAYATVGDGDISANSMIRSGTIGGTLTMSHAERYCIVVEPENYAGSDSYLLRSVNSRSAWTGQVASYNGTSWTGVNGGVAFAFLEFTDGTFGTIGHGAPLTAVGLGLTFNSGSNPDEIALKINPVTPLTVVGMCAENPYSTTGGDFEFVLYEGTTPMATLAIDANVTFNTSITTTLCGMFGTAQSLAVGPSYYAAVKPTTANNVRVNYNTAADAAHWSIWGGGSITNYSARVDGGSWSDTDTRRPSIWLLVSGVGSGSTASSGAYVVVQ